LLVGPNIVAIVQRQQEDICKYLQLQNVRI
jgi:hypothetical protein